MHRVPLIGDKGPFGPEDRANKAAGITSVAAGRDNDEAGDGDDGDVSKRGATKSLSLLTR